jgi:hypothetical protein
VSPQDDDGHRLRLPRREEIIGPALELTVYLCTSLAMLWPLTFKLGSGIAGWKDARYYTWATWKTGEMLSSGDLTLRVRDIVWPYGVDIRHIDGHLPTLIGGLWNLVATPELAQNLGLLTGVALSLWAGRRLGKVFSPHRTVWVLTAIAFATAPAIAARLEVHLTMTYAFPVALLVEEAVRMAWEDRPLRPIRLGLLLFVAFLCGIYFVVFGAIAFGLIVLLSSRPRAVPRTMLRGAGAAALALVLLLPFLMARLDLDRAEREAGRNPELLASTFKSSADGLSIVSQPPSSTLDLPGMSMLRRHFLKNVHESTIFPGFLLLGGFAGMVFLRSRLRWSLLFTSLALWLLALGTSLTVDGQFVVAEQAATTARPTVWLPYAAFLQVPGLASLRSPNRASFALAAVLTAAAALSLGWLFARFGRTWQRVAMSAAAGGLLLTNLLIPIHTEEIVTSPALGDAFRAVAQRARPGESMVEVPADCAGQTHSVTFQILHGTPLVGCQTSSAAVPWSSLELYRRSAALAALRCDPMRIGAHLMTPFTRDERFDATDVASLRAQMGVRFYLVDKRALEEPTCERVSERLPVLESYELVGEDSEWIVVDTGPIEDGDG